MWKEAINFLAQFEKKKQTNKRKKKKKPNTLMYTTECWKIKLNSIFLARLICRWRILLNNCDGVSAVPAGKFKF